MVLLGIEVKKYIDLELSHDCCSNGIPWGVWTVGKSLGPLSSTLILLVGNVFSVLQIMTIIYLI